MAVVVPVVVAVPAAVAVPVAVAVVVVVVAAIVAVVVVAVVVLVVVVVGGGGVVVTVSSCLNELTRLHLGWPAFVSRLLQDLQSIDTHHSIDITCLPRYSR